MMRCDNLESLTRNYIAGIQRIIVFNETEAVHEFDLRNFSIPVVGKECFDFRFGHCSGGS